MPHTESGKPKEPGPSAAVPSDATAFDIVKLLWEDALKLILETTKKQMKEDKQMRQFDVDEELLWRYFAVVLCMGLNPHPSVNEYWSLRSQFYGVPIIADLLSRDMFKNISSTLKSDIKEEHPKIQELLVTRFKTYWYVSGILVVDETIIPFKGKFKARQKIPLKPHATGKR